jgi:protein-tyrosine phosphatase
MHPDSALVLQGLGGDPRGFRAQQLRADCVERADLVLTMTRYHRTLVLQEVPRALAKTFTLREAAALLASVGEGALSTGAWPQNGRALVRALADARSGGRDTAADDVADPVGGPLQAHQEAGDLIAQAWIPLLQRIGACVREGDGVSTR